MDQIAVLIIFGLCICLLIFAYLITAVRCSMCCWRGLKNKQIKEDRKDGMEITAVTVVDIESLTANGSKMTASEDNKTTTEDIPVSNSPTEAIIIADEGGRVIIYCPGDTSSGFSTSISDDTS